jgi:hypothetical protein
MPIGSTPGDAIAYAVLDIPSGALLAGSFGVTYVPGPGVAESTWTLTAPQSAERVFVEAFIETSNTAPFISCIRQGSAPGEWILGAWDVVAQAPGAPATGTAHLMWWRGGAQ